MPSSSPFLSPDATTKDNELAILYIRRDQSIPTVLSAKANPELDTGYAEGVVTNTRFGSFPHSTLVGLPWGSQVRASLVDTGSRGRRQLRPPPGQKKRKADAIEEVEAEEEEGDDDDDDEEETRDGHDGADGAHPALSLEGGLEQKEAVAAGSGFIHILPPTPENWTASLPHRTQVVYTPDYSYILHRIRARPGSVLIEAGSGSGSFTHAAARAVFNGYPDGPQQLQQGAGPSTDTSSWGRVFSYEYHADRYAKMKEEIKLHGLDSIVTVIERDVYRDGFVVTETGDVHKFSACANAVFLDLPSPWLALPHLTRQGSVDRPSPLDPDKTVYLCTFSPCVEQVQKTASALRHHGWQDIDMVEIQHKRIEVRREYTGLAYEGMRGVNGVAADVDEALAKLTDLAQRTTDFHADSTKAQAQTLPQPGASENSTPSQPAEVEVGAEADPRQRKRKQELRKKPLFNDGRLVHKSEPELKTHTSYLLFAILPIEWTDEDEAQARAKWNTQTGDAPTSATKGFGFGFGFGPKSQRQLKREAKQKAQAQAEKANRKARTDKELVVEGKDEVEERTERRVIEDDTISTTSALPSDQQRQQEAKEEDKQEDQIE